MDAQQFDRLTQQLGQAFTRRRFGAVLAALGLAAGLGVAGDGDAKRKKKKKKKPEPCAAGTVRCGSACVNTQADSGNCGGCGNRCGNGQTCSGGQCQSNGGCAGNQVSCGGQCVDTQSNAQHCGSCGNGCTGGQTCSGGQCQGGGCSGGQVSCNGHCVDTQTDNRHCGECGVPCNVGRCIGGRCVECVNQDDCGGFGSFNDLVCRDGSCVCDTAGEGICQRYPDRRGRCHVCCPGGSGACRFDEICFYNPDAPNGPLALCDCPTGWQRCNYQPHPTGTCVQDPLTDSRKCGPFCEDCTASTEFPAICCNGLCFRGCGGPGTSSCPRGQVCGPNCLPCNSDSICCNMGPRTLPRCIPDIYGGTCYQN